MILAIDMGNTNIVIGGIDEKNTYFLERLNTRKDKTELEYAINIKSILEIYKININAIEGAILSSVVPPLNNVIIRAIKKVTNLDCILVNNNMNLDLNIAMDNPCTVGSDLIVDSVAAMSEYTLPLAVIDMGTATTIFVVDKNKNYIGGIIHPGVKISLEALSTNTAKLPQINLELPKSVIAKNTVDSMCSGILYGHAGMLDNIISHMEKELNEKLTIIATGGLAHFVIPLCKNKIIIDENLLLKGLLILYKKNSI